MKSESVRQPRRLVAGLQAPLPQQPPDPVADRGDRLRHLGITRRRRRMELEGARVGFGEDPVEHQRMKSARSD